MFWLKKINFLELYFHLWFFMGYIRESSKGIRNATVEGSTKENGNSQNTNQVGYYFS